MGKKNNNNNNNKKEVKRRHRVDGTSDHPPPTCGRLQRGRSGEDGRRAARVREDNTHEQEKEANHGDYL